MNDTVNTQNFKTDIFNGQYDAELEKSPHYMRERVAFLIEQKVEKRVQEHMSVFREEVARELEDQRQQNEHHIAYYMDPHVRAVAPPNKYRQYGGWPGYAGAGYHPYHYGPNYRHNKLASSFSPVRYKSDLSINNSIGYQDDVVRELNDPKGYRTESTTLNVQPYRPKKKQDSKLPQEKWTGYITTNYEEEKIKKDKLDRRRQYDHQLKQKAYMNKNQMNVADGQPLSHM